MYKQNTRCLKNAQCTQQKAVPDITGRPTHLSVAWRRLWPARRSLCQWHEELCTRTETSDAVQEPHQSVYTCPTCLQSTRRLTTVYTSNIDTVPCCYLVLTHLIHSALEHQGHLLNTRAPIYSHFRTCPPFRPQDDVMKISWWHLLRFRSYRVDRQTHKRTRLKTMSSSLRGRSINTSNF